MADLLTDDEVMGRSRAGGGGPALLSDDEVMGRSEPGGEGLVINMTRQGGAGDSPDMPDKKEIPMAARPLVGANRAIAGIVGAPVDAMTWGINKVGRGVQALTGEPRQDIITNPIGGSESIKKGLGLIGANPDDVRPATTTGEKVLEATGEGAAAMLVPGLGAEALLTRSMKASETLGAELTKIIAGTGVLSNTAIGAAGGALGEVAAEAVPDNGNVNVGPLEFSPGALKDAARLGGNIAGGGVVAGVQSGVEAGGRAVAGAVRSATEAPELQAARQIMDRAENPGALRQTAQGAAEAPALVEGSSPTLFQATGDKGVGALEREVAASPKGVPRFAGVREEQNTARVAELDKLQKSLPENATADDVASAVQGRAAGLQKAADAGVSDARQAALNEIEALKSEGNPGAVVGYVQRQVDDLTKTFEDRVSDARRQLDERFRAGRLNEAEYSAALREVPIRLRTELEQTESALWDAVDPDRVAPFNPQNLKSGVDSIEKSIPRTAEPPEGKEAALFDVILGPASKGPNGTVVRQGGLDEATTFGDIAALRSRITDRMRDPANTPTVDRRLKLMLREVENALGEENAVSSPEVLQRYAAARASTAEKYERFGGKGTVGAILAEGDREGFRMTASNVAKNIFDRPEDLRTYLTAVGDDAAARAHLRDYAAFSLRKAAMKDGMLSEGNYQKWMANHEYVLREFPELREQFGNIRSAQTALDEALAAQKQALSEYQTGALSRVLENQDPTKAIGGALNNPAEFGAIVARVRNDPEALAGLKRAVVDYMMNRSLRSAEGGVPQTSVAAMEKFYLQNKATLESLFGDDLAKKLASARNAQTSLDQALDVQANALSDYQTGAIKRLLNTQDPEIVITNALRRPGEFEALVKEVANDPAAKAGMKRAVIDYMMKQARSTAEAGTSGVEQINAATLQKFYLNNRRSLAALFDPEELLSIENVTKDLQRANRSIVALKIPGGSNTAQDTGGRTMTILRHMMSQYGGKAAGGGAGAMFGPVGMVAGVAAGAVADAMRVARVNSVENALVEMMLDPKMAAIWLKEVPAKDGAATASAFARRLKALTAAQVMQEIEREGRQSLPVRQ